MRFRLCSHLTIIDRYGIIEEVFVGYDAEGSRWSDHMGGHVIDCNGKNVTEAINSIVTKLNELVGE